MLKMPYTNPLNSLNIEANNIENSLGNHFSFSLYANFRLNINGNFVFLAVCYYESLNYLSTKRS